MALQKRSSSLDLSKHKPGLVYDAESVSLLGKYTDELSAHRGKRLWMETLSNYFLLELERDYELYVESCVNNRSYVLCCEFNSACGRYAFWRLINQQAPEAEAKLGGTINKTPTRAVHRNPGAMGSKDTWLFGRLDAQIEDTSETKHLLSRILKLFQN